MKEKKPRFELTRVNEDGSKEPAQIVPLAEAIDARMNRRGFFGAGLTAAAAVMLLEGNAPPKSESTYSDRPIDRNCGKKYAHSDDVVALALSRDGSMLASGSNDGTVKCWIPSDHALVGVWKTKYPRQLALAPDGRMIAFSISEQEIELRSLPDGKLLKSFQAQYAAFDPNGGRLILLRKNTLEIYNTSEEKSVLITIDAGTVEGLALSPDGEYTVVGSPDGLWLFDGNGVNGEKISPRGILPVFSFDGEWLAYLRDKTVILFHTPDYKTLTGATLNNDRQISFSSDGKWFFAAPALIAWDTESLKSKGIAPIANELSMVCMPDGEFVITGGSKGSIKVWQLPNFEFFTCLMDIECSGKEEKGGVYTYTDEWGQTLSYTLPCGAPLPIGAICTCNCVPGKMEQICSCNKVCTCDQVCSCNRVCSCQSYGSTCSCNKVCTCNLVYY
ncbi:MAG: WD40 repeat domain-containing protein [Prevotellaceae bacterium]|jgi:WD40 repeat protein|nr:WD40 repeat domain-containing protein [Prevotellaceae bacterium]